MKYIVLCVGLMFDLVGCLILFAGDYSGGKGVAGAAFLSLGIFIQIIYFVHENSGK